jgi:hypothetical protein
MRGHGVRVVVQDAPYDLLRDVAVDQARPERYLYLILKNAW